MKTYTAPQLLDKVNAYLKDMPYSRPPKGLYEPIAYELSLGGKRIRRYKPEYNKLSVRLRSPSDS